MADKNNKKRSGLHKEISSIFDGVPIPSDRTVPRPNAGSERGRAGYDSPRPPAKPLQNPQIPDSNQRFKQPTVAHAKAGQAAAAVGGGPLQQVVKRLFGPKSDVSSGRQKLTALFVPVLFIVLVVLLVKNLGILSPKTKGSVIPKPTTPVAAVPTGTAWQKPEPYPITLRDPMQLTDDMTGQIKAQADAKAQAKADALVQQQTVTITTGPQTTEVGELTVKGILFSDDNPSAVIGTEIAHVGDIIAGATIVNVNRRSVEFEKDGETWTQSVEP